MGPTNRWGYGHRMKLDTFFLVNIIFSTNYSAIRGNYLTSNNKNIPPITISRSKFRRLGNSVFLEYCLYFCSRNT